jgi:hypothetical protein
MRATRGKTAPPILIALLALALVAAAVAFIYMPEAATALRAARGSGGRVYVADLDYWQRTPRERQVVTPYAFDLDHSLADIPLAIGNWRGQDVPQTNVGVFMVLEPEQYVERIDRNPQGQYLWLTLIGGRGSQTFHPPESCYQSYGWQTELHSHAVTLDQGELVGMLLEAHQYSKQELAYYVYLFPTRSRTPADGIVIFKVTSPLYGSVEESLALQAGFVRNFFTEAASTAGGS